MSYRKQVLANKLESNFFLGGPESGPAGEVVGRALVGADISAALAELGVSTDLTVSVGDIGKVLKVVADGTLATMSWEFPYPETTLVGSVLVSNGDNTTSWDTPTLNFAGDATGSGVYNNEIALTLKDSGVVAGTYLGITVDSKGIVTSADASLPSSINFGSYEAGSTNVATLDANGHVPFDQLPQDLLGVLKFKGVFDISTEVALPANPATGDYYLVSDTLAVGSRDFNDTTDPIGAPEIISLSLKDIILFTGDPEEKWVKLDNTEQVISVNGKVGAVTLAVGDISGAASTTDLSNAVSTINGLISSEEAARIAGDAALGTLITNLDLALDAEEAARIATDSTLSGLISGLDTDLDNEVLARTAADATLQNNITAEAVTRLAADEALSTLISSLQSSVSGDINAAIGTLQAGLASETSARIAADSALGTLVSSVQGEVDALEILHASEVSTLQANLAAEQAARIDADAALGTLISSVSEELGIFNNFFLAANGTLQANIDAEATLRTNADNALSTLISNLDGELAQEVLDRTAADGILQANIDALSTLVANSANVLPIAIKFADYQMVATDSTVAVNMALATSDITVTLPIDPVVGQVINIKRLGDDSAFDVILDSSPSGWNIDGEINQFISYAWGNITCQYAGAPAGWIIL